MQNGLLLCAALLGFSHIKWAANDKGRKEGQMLTLYLCPKTDGALNVKPEEITVPSEAISMVEARLKTAKQFDTFLISLEKQRERLVFKGFFEMPK